MSDKPKVPYTPILARYHQVIAEHDEARLDLAKQLAKDPTVLAADFERSITELSTGYRSTIGFRPQPKQPRAPKPPGSLRNGTDLAWHLRGQRGLQVDHAPDLAVEWVDYELSILRTLGGAIFDRPVHNAAAGDDPAKARGPIRVDLVLRNTADHTPVVGETKVKRDKEPFSALVQTLAYIAHLSTADQYARLRTHLPHADFPSAEAPRFDGYLLLYDFGASPSTYLEALKEQAEVAAAGVMQQPIIRRHIRRLVCLDVSLKDGHLGAALRWRKEGGPTPAAGPSTPT